MVSILQSALYSSSYAQLACFPLLEMQRPRMEPSNCQPKLAGGSFCSRPASMNSLSTMTPLEESLSCDPENQDGAESSSLRVRLMCSSQREPGCYWPNPKRAFMSARCVSAIPE